MALSVSTAGRSPETCAVRQAARAQAAGSRRRKTRATNLLKSKPEVVRSLVTRLADGSTLLVGDERRRSDEILAGVLTAFAWAVAATLALGTVGGLWLSAQFLGRTIPCG